VRRGIARIQPDVWREEFKIASRAHANANVNLGDMVGLRFWSGMRWEAINLKSVSLFVSQSKGSRENLLELPYRAPKPVVGE